MFITQMKKQVFRADIVVIIIFKMINTLKIMKIILFIL
jgi:hypothetical protein